MGVKKVTEKKEAARKAAVAKGPKKAEPRKSGKVIELPSMDVFPTLHKGDKGGYVTVLQTNLQNRGYDIGKEGVDGRFGEKTLKAVKEFQKDAGMAVPSGIVGPKGWELLRTSNVFKAAPKPAEPAAPVSPVSGNAQAVTLGQQPQGGARVLIEGLTRYQAELLVKMLSGHTDCRIL